VDDLVQFIINLFQNDSELLAIFEENGQPTVQMLGIQRRVPASYPIISILAEDGKQEVYGDENAAFTHGKIRLEVVCRQTTSCVDAELCRQQITARIKQLLLGYPVSGDLGVSNTQVSTQYKCCYLRQTIPTGEIPTLSDPKDARWRGTYDVLMNENSWYNLVPPGNFPASV
jgi:hypothetical protein